MRRLRLFLFLFVGVLLGGGCSMAFAQYSGSMVPPDIRLSGPNNLPFDYSTGKYVGFGAGSGGGAALNSSYAGRLGGAMVPISGTRAIPGSALARVGVGLARLAGPVSLGMTLAPLIWDELSQMWKAQDQPPGEYDAYYWISAAGGGSCTTVAEGCSHDQSGQAACAYVGGTYNGIRTILSEQYHQVWCSGTGYDTQTIARTATPRVVSYHPATDSEIEDAIYVELVARGFGSELARRLVEAGYEPAVIAEAGPQNLSGPTSVQGPSSTSTTTGPGGQTTVVTNTTYNITYSGDTMSVTENTTTTTTYPDNSTETTTETKTPTTEPPAEVPSEDPPQTDCEKFPKASGCEELGEVDDSDLDQETETVSWSSEGSAAGSCPVPKVWNTQFGTYAIEWTPVCNFASGIRPFVIGIAWLGAGLFIFMVAKEKA